MRELRGSDRAKRNWHGSTDLTSSLQRESSGDGSIASAASMTLFTSMRRYSREAETLQRHHRPAGVGGHHHDVDAARRVFDAHDHGRSGHLGVTELVVVAEEVWRAGHPTQPILNSEGREVCD